MTEVMEKISNIGFAVKKVNVHISAVLLTALFFVTGDGVLFGALIFAAMLHEIGHLIAIKIAGVKIKSVNITAIGASIETDGFSSYRKDMAISFAGPFVNLLAFSFAYAVYASMGNVTADSFLSVFCGINLILFTLNLIPVLPLDGGVVLRSYLMLKYERDYAHKLMFYISLCSAVTLFALGCVCFYHTKFNISVMLIALFLIFNVSRYEKIA